MAIKHKAVKASQSIGLATEWNDDHEFTSNADMEQYQFLNQVIENRTDFPAGPVEGQVVWRSDLNMLYCWNGTNWALQTDKGASFPLAPIVGQIFYRTDNNTFYGWNGSVWTILIAFTGDMGGQKITGLGEPTSDDDAATKKYADDCDLAKWLTTNGVLVGGDGSKNNGTLTLYTVPAGKECYVVSAAIQVRPAAVSISGICCFVLNGINVLKLTTSLIDEVQEEIAMSFSMPIKLTVGQTVAISSSDIDAYIRGSWAGYEITL